MPWRLNPFTGKLDWTDVVTPLTSGSVLFADSSGFITQDNTNFFWDDTNNRLGIGTNSPQATSHFSGVGASLSSSYASTIFEDGTAIASRTGTGGKAEFRGVFNTAGDKTIAGLFGASKANQTSGDSGFDMVFSPRRNGAGSFEERMRLSSTGKLGIGISNPDNRLLAVEETIGSNVFGLYSFATTSFVRSQWKQGAVNTTDATLTTVCTFAMPSSSAVLLRAHVLGHRTGGTAGTADDSAVYVMTAAYKPVAGVPTIIGAATMDFQAEDQPAWNCQFVASGSSVLVRVTGAANNNITWHCTLNFSYVNN